MTKKIEMPLEYLLSEAKKFSSRTEFCRKSKTAYKRCLELGIMDEAFSHVIKYNALNGKHGNCTITDERIFSLAKLFDQKSKFKESYPTEYKAARTRGIWKEACTHMRVVGNRLFRAIYVFEHSDNTAYIGLSYDPEKRKETHFRNNDILIEKSKNTIQVFKILTELLPQKEAAIKEDEIIEKYRTNGWIILNKAKGGSLGSGELKWTKEECAKIISKCSKRSDFVKYHPSAYQSARVHGWLEELLSHFPPKINEPWLETELEVLAKQCSTRYDFKNKYPGAYRAARNLKILDKICMHMPKNCGLLPKKDRPIKNNP